MQILPKKSVSGIELPAMGQPSAAASEAGQQSLATRVSLSSSAREKAAGSQHPPATQSLASKDAHADPRAAEQIAHDLAYTEDSMGVDASDWVNGTGPLKIKSTGQPLTPEFEARFKADASAIREQRIALYESEKSNGTLAAQIVDKLESMFKELPKDYQDLVRSKGD